MTARGVPSFWLETCGEALTPRPALPGDTDADVVIVGAGYTGLWTAHHLLRADPALRVVVLEREVSGWGASGRNGGWCSALFAQSWDRVAREHGAQGAQRMRRALERTVDDVGTWCTEHGVDAHYAKGGTLTLARGRAQAEGLLSWVAQEHETGDRDVVLLTAEEARARVAAAGVDGGAWSPHCAALHPGRLVRGLARVVEKQGARLYEQTGARHIEPRCVRTDHGHVRADVVVRATEGYTAELPGQRRALVPLWSLVLATEPVDDETWQRIGWHDRETVTDGRHLIIYAQRTADGRVVFGGRGAPYRYASRTDGTAGHERAFRRLESALTALLPQLRDVQVTHRWGGVLGVPRDWTPAVVFDQASGFGWAGGYVGDGVGCAALAGRTLADLILGRETEESTLPWVGHHWRRWEPEPLRWLGVQTMAAVMGSADDVEARTGRPARRAALVNRLVGH